MKAAENGREVMPPTRSIAPWTGNADTEITPIRTALERAAASSAQNANFAAPRPARLMLAVDHAERLFLVATEDATASIVAALIHHRLAYGIVRAAQQCLSAFSALRRTSCSAPGRRYLRSCVASPRVAGTTALSQ